MKRLLWFGVTAALAATGFAAGSSWFDGGLGTAWPTAAATGGSWSDTALGSWVAGETPYLQVTANDGTPLGFNATTAQKLSANRATVVSKLGFITPYAAADVPEPPANAKAGVITAVTGSVTNYWVLSANADRSANEWKKTDIVAPTGLADVTITTCIATNGLEALYTFEDGSTYGPVFIKVSDQTINGVAYEGSGRVAAVSATSAKEWTVEEDVPVAGMTDENRIQVGNQLDAIQTALTGVGSEQDVNAWLSMVYGGKQVDASKVAASRNVELSVNYDIPLLENADTPTVSVADAGDANFDFELKDGLTPLEIVQITDRLKALLLYTSSLQVDFGPIGSAVSVEAKDGKIRASFVDKSEGAGFLSTKGSL